jgi:hypothetical protein
LGLALELDANDRSHLNNPIDVWDRFTTDQQTPRKPSTKIRSTRKQRDFPSLLEELEAVQDALEAFMRRTDDLETTMSMLLNGVPPAALERLPDETLRRVFAKLPEPIQDALLRGDQGPRRGSLDC